MHPHTFIDADQTERLVKDRNHDGPAADAKQAGKDTGHGADRDGRCRENQDIVQRKVYARHVAPAHWPRSGYPVPAQL